MCPEASRCRGRSLVRNLTDVDDGFLLGSEILIMIERRASELAALKDLRQAVERTEEELPARLRVGQDTVSRIKRRSDCGRTAVDRTLPRPPATFDRTYC